MQLYLLKVGQLLRFTSVLEDGRGVMYRLRKIAMVSIVQPPVLLLHWLIQRGLMAEGADIDIMHRVPLGFKCRMPKLESNTRKLKGQDRQEVATDE